jgi:oligopeptide transport system substrate-binding protein
MDFIFFGFNMEDTLLGGYTDDKRYLRQSIALAIDWEKRNEVFYDGLCTIYDGMIPPGLDGFPPNGEIRGSYRGPDLERAKELISKAGFPDGQRLPPIPHFLTDSEFGSEMAAMTKKQLGEIGVEIDVQRLDFESFMKRVDQRQAPMFYFSWVSDYPDAENNLALFYGPNQSPGKNYFNYQNDEFDKLYEQTLEMPPGPARTALYVQLRKHGHSGLCLYRFDGAESSLSREP